MDHCKEKSTTRLHEGDGWVMDQYLVLGFSCGALDPENVVGTVAVAYLARPMIRLLRSIEPFSEISMNRPAQPLLCELASHPLRHMPNVYLHG
jgi:hypothetical protein